MSRSKRSAWIDANVALRFLLRDNEKHFKSVSEIFREAEDGKIILIIHVLALAEIVWTLESYYEYPRDEISKTLEEFIEAEGIEVQDKTIVKNALLSYREKSVDFIDAYLAAFASSKGPATIYTLDQKHFSQLEGDIRIL